MENSGFKPFFFLITWAKNKSLDLRLDQLERRW